MWLIILLNVLMRYSYLFLMNFVNCQRTFGIINSSTPHGSKYVVKQRFDDYEHAFVGNQHLYASKNLLELELL